MGWVGFAMTFAELDITERLVIPPRASLDAMIGTGTNAPLSSSCRQTDRAGAGDIAHACGGPWLCADARARISDRDGGPVTGTRIPLLRQLSAYPGKNATGG